MGARDVWMWLPEDSLFGQQSHRETHDHARKTGCFVGMFLMISLSPLQNFVHQGGGAHTASSLKRGSRK